MKNVIKIKNKDIEAFNERGEKICKGKSYLEYLKEAYPMRVGSILRECHNKTVVEKLLAKSKKENV